MSDKNRQSLSGSHGIDDPDQNVDKIREILFGGQMRDYQRRFETLEADVNAANDRLRSDLSKRIESLEAFVRQEMEQLGERLANERRERGEERETGAAEIHDLRQRLEDTLSQAARDTRSIRATLDDKSRELSRLIEQSRDDFNTMLSRDAKRKVGREDLAALLSELAARLNSEPDSPAD